MTKFKILLVDDDEIFREAVEISLVSQGYEVITAPTGKSALILMASHKIDLIISDIRMPEMDGVELVKIVRSKSKIPIILVTGFSEIMETKTAYELGANEFLAKPFKREELLTAIQRCLGVANSNKDEQQEPQYCKLGINDFISGRTIKFNVFVLLTGAKFIKIAHKGEDISPERIKYYREKGLNFFYLKREDFRKYVGFSLSLAKTDQKANAVSHEKKLNLLRQTGEILNEQIRRQEIDAQVYESAAAFVEATLDILTDDVNATNILEALNNHTDYLFAHSVGVSLYSVLIAQVLNWNLPTNKFKVAMGGLLHDVGMKEIDKDILTKPRYSWHHDEIKLFEDHPLRGINILNDISDISEDIRDIVRQHHENCLSRGYPARINKMAIHPMAKLISVADEFCYRTIKNPHSEGLGPIDALQDMKFNCADLLDKKIMDALLQVFKGSPS